MEQISRGPCIILSKDVVSLQDVVTGAFPPPPFLEIGFEVLVAVAVKSVVL
jgi:hypothetical protein